MIREIDLEPLADRDPSDGIDAAQQLPPHEVVRVRSGNATAVLECRCDGAALTVELAQCSNHGRTLLSALASAVASLARRERTASLQWIVHTAACAIPNSAFA